MIFHALLIKHEDKFLIRDSNGHEQDINDTAYILVAVYTTTSYNNTMKQFTTTLHGVLDDKVQRTFNTIRLLECEKCGHIMKEQVKGEHCGHEYVKILEFYDIPTIR